LQRLPVTPRPNFEVRVRETDFRFHSIDGEAYWDESAYYAFTLQEIEGGFEAPTNELAALCLELAGRVVKSESLLQRLAIPRHAWDIIAESWHQKHPSLYGRFDFAYNGKGPAKLLEYNADTPTALFEASVFQWLWLEDAIEQRLLPTGSDQFNSIHERLIRRLAELREVEKPSSRLHLAYMRESIEDYGLVSHLEDCALQAGFATCVLGIGDIGTTGEGPFVDLDNNPIELLFKLHPWEWMFADKSGRSSSLYEPRFIEPPWKAILSNKGILPLLWEMEPAHPNLLPSYFEDSAMQHPGLEDYARKPLYSREGGNVVLIKKGEVDECTGGPYGKEGYIWQARAAMPAFDGRFPVIGSWIVGAGDCGIGIREDTSLITKDTSRFLPHAIIP
jgi:glutathionylspermidine synthase